MAHGNGDDLEKPWDRQRRVHAVDVDNKDDHRDDLRVDEHELAVPALQQQ